MSGTKIEHVLFVTRNWYQTKLVPNGISDASEIGPAFLVFGADFW